MAVTLFGASLDDAWASFVAQGLITSRCTRDSDGRELEMGLRLNAQDGAVEEFAKLLGDSGEELFDPTTTPDRTAGPFAVRVVGYRAFRPGAGAMVAMCPFEPHNVRSCSLCGALSPYRLQLREPLLQLRAAAAAAAAASGTEEEGDVEEVPDWTAHYNIAPCERAGHVLLVPRLVDSPTGSDTTVGAPGSQRSQRLLEADCTALVAILARSRGFSITYNAERGGASQNHVHAQGWASAAWGGGSGVPAVARAARVPLLATGVDGAARVATLAGDSYPAFAAVLTAPGAAEGAQPGSAAGRAARAAAEAALAAELWRLVDRLQSDCTPFNLFLSRCGGGDGSDSGGGDAAVQPTVFVFVRDAAKEITSAFPNIKIAGIQLAGIMLLDCPFTDIQAEYAATTEERIATALRETTIAPDDGVALLRDVFSSSAFSVQHSHSPGV